MAAPGPTLDPGLHRTRIAWLLALVFFFLARPTGPFLLAGAATGLLGMALRGWAAGTVDKNERLTTSGPYARVRHPMYLGSLLVGVGLTLAGGHWAWPLLFLAYFAAFYPRLVRDETAMLDERFGAEHRAYVESVPALRPTLRRFRGGGSDGEGFDLSRWRRNREWMAVLGFAAGFSVLLAKWLLSG